MDMLPRVIGIDIGKRSIMLAFPPFLTNISLDSPPSKWVITQLHYSDSDWWNQLIQLIDVDGADVVWEASNYFLFAPVLSIIETYRPKTRIWVVNTGMAKHYRESHVSNTKSDAMDARALALIGQDVLNGKAVRNVRLYNHLNSLPAHYLRLWVNLYTRLKRDHTRNQNRLNALGHALYPLLGGSKVWFRAVRLGYVDLEQMHELSLMNPRPAEYTSMAFHHLQRFISNRPRISGNEEIISMIKDLDVQQQELEEKINTVYDRIREIINTTPFSVVSNRWRTIPLCSDIFLATLHAATYGRIQEFSKNEFRAAIGVCPNIGTSGDTARRIGNRRGYLPAKSAIYLWAMGLISPSAPENIVRSYYQEGRTFSAARNKLARILWGVARDNRLD